MDDTMNKETAAELLDNLVGMVSDTQDNNYDLALKMGIEALRAERHGYWHIYSDDYEVSKMCSSCNSTISFNSPEYPRCPFCGAWMHGKDWFENG